MQFRNRRQAGQLLADKLSPYKSDGTVVLGLARGGVPVAYEVATALGAELDTIVVRKLGVPYNLEFGFGAIAEGETIIMSDEIINMLKLTEEQIAAAVERAKKECADRMEIYHPGSRLTEKAITNLILVDDGLATGLTMEAAIASARKRYAPKYVIVAVPVAAKDSADRIREQSDELVTLHESETFSAVGQFYDEFSQTSDEEVISFLKQR